MAEHIDGLAEALRRENYSENRGKDILSLVGKFSRFAAAAGITKAELIDEDLVDRFINEELACEGAYTSSGNAMCHMLKYLRSKGVIEPVPEKTEVDPFSPLLDRYTRHLLDVRGLAQKTVDDYITGARKFLNWLKDHRGNKPLEKISGPDVLDFISVHLPLHRSRSRRKGLCGDTRIFLRFLLWDGVIDSDLSRVVPKVSHYRLDNVPKHLPWEKVRALINGIDTSHPEGMRDKAILLLLACLGLRNIEVRKLTLGQIDWRRAELRLPETKNRKERVLPLPQEVGAALADYVLHGRPALDTPYVFLRHRAPRGPLTTHASIREIIHRHLLRSGIDAPNRGAYLLRHSLATRMVNTGVPIKNIADILGHASIDTTAIYTKVDMAHLAAVALPFPGGAL